MKFLASALLALLFVPVESALGQEPNWDRLGLQTSGAIELEPNGCILGPHRDASLGQKPQNSLESVTSAVWRVPPTDRKVSH